MITLFSGSGPGLQTRDGCSVELYRDLPYLGELDDILPALHPGERVLELGCGTGRLTRRLLSHGLSVTAVDNSAEMLRDLPVESTPVLCDIETLVLAARFDVVLLASCLVNHPDLAVRSAFLSAAYRHLVPGGRLFVRRHDPAWLRGARRGDVHGPVDDRIAVEAVDRVGDHVAMTIRYDRSAGTWRQSFVAEVLDDVALEDAFQRAGFERPIWHGQRRRWASTFVGTLDTTE